MGLQLKGSCKSFAANCKAGAVLVNLRTSTSIATYITGVQDSSVYSPHVPPATPTALPVKVCEGSLCKFLLPFV
eukprot:2868329-Amphidinium_carterae.1